MDVHPNGAAARVAQPVAQPRPLRVEPADRVVDRRSLEVEAATVDDAIGRLDAQWPGLRDRLCDPSRGDIRQHIHVYVDRERAGLETPLEPRSRVDVIAAISGG